MKNTLDKITCAVKGIAATLLSVLGLLVVVQAVFGSTAIITLWQYLMYKLDSEEKVENEELRIVKQKEA